MRRAILEVSIELLTSLCKGLAGGYAGHYEVTDNGIPEDTKVVDYLIDQSARTVSILLESEKFEDVSKSNHQPYPTLPCTVLRSIKDDDPLPGFPKAMHEATRICTKLHDDNSIIPRSMVTKFEDDEHCVTLRYKSKSPNRTLDIEVYDNHECCALVWDEDKNESLISADIESDNFGEVIKKYEDMV